MANVIQKELSYRLAGLACLVHKILGPDLLEQCYVGGMVVELQRLGIPFQRQQYFPVFYRGELVGSYFADLVVDNKVILEFKSVKALCRKCRRS